ncbi:olfactomedin-like protein 2B isoform X1 [Electrophorus electricus]|uniref:olfactomedin-like protein 2B isoform X1 n=1 Tax=Electrophorus electricus TaxID=8005 RepID=UPI0015CFBF08|nr:olfactomedin-like protein 2B isoform X1 [Electrophorus electricus]
MPSSILLLLVWYGALCCAPLAWSSVGNSTSKDRQPATEVTEKNSATLEDEMDNQENILTQLLGDYDKVKTLSEGSNCHCKCVVRPLSRSACKRIEEGRAKREDFYTVETVTVGPNCKKCACIAPPSALNPCEGDFRFKKLQEAGNNIKLATIMDLLEGASYGMDLLKLHSVTTKLLERMDNTERSFFGNGTRERGGVKGDVGVGKGSRAHQCLEKKRRLSKLEPSLQKKAAAAFSHAEKKYEEKFVGNEGSNRPLLKKSHSEGPEAQNPKNQRTKIDPNGISIKRVTFYKADGVENEDGEHKAPDDVVSGDGSVDLIIQDQIPKQKLSAPTPATGYQTTAIVASVLEPSSSSQKVNKPTHAPNGPTAASVLTVTEQPKPEPRETTELTATSPTVLVALTTSTTTTIQAVATNNVASITGPPTVQKPSSNFTAMAKRDTVKSRITWDEGPAEAATEVPKNSGVCKDTLATIGDPVTRNTYGRNEGAWMKDPKGNGKVIYVTNYYYGNNLLEFRDMDTFKQGRFTNSYKLPYNWIGTGHVVYNGAFYYNRAFSRDIIRFDLRLRYVAAWTTLHDAVFEEEEAPWRWRGHSDIDFAVDESGLWMLYPALDEEGFHQEVIVLNKLNPYDLHKENAWRTGLRRNTYGNSFVICGVLYAVDSYEHMNANISYAFDTHTHTQMVPWLPFVNNYTYTTQIDYNPKDRMLYAWDNGRQVTYDVIFAY